MHDCTWQKSLDTPATRFNVRDNRIILELNDLNHILVHPPVVFSGLEGIWRW